MPIFDTEEIVRRDVEALHKLGYAQQLLRRMSLFGNFALSFMIIGVFWGACVNVQQGFSTAGMFGLSAIFLTGSLIAYATAASLGEISSAIPTAGGLYYWSSVLGGRGWGWATAWINLLAYTFSIGGTAVGIYLIFNEMVLGWVCHIDTSSWGFWPQTAGVTIIIVSQAIFNHAGVRLLARLSEIGAYITFVGAVLLFAILLYNVQPANIPHLFKFVNYTGAAGGNIVPHTNNLVLVFGYALLLPLWIITSYDASAHTAEETLDPSRAVPKAMINAVLLSATMGILLLTVIGLAMKDQAAIARQGGNAFATLFTQIAAPSLVKDFIAVSMSMAAYICGACGLTGFSRAAFAFARDKGLPTYLKQVSGKFRTPAPAIWACAVVSIAVTLYSPAFVALVAGTALFYQLSYVMAILAAMASRNRKYGPYRLGIWSKPLGVLAVIGGAFILWVGLQPPTDVLVNYFLGILGLLLIGWFAFERRRFPGPPIGEAAIRQRQREIEAEEAAVGEK
ncbi:MAG TPA: amino acid permease [Bryobacteraceae bacterium]|nr:amino acid permease [Bryobacteraceae bacterium]